MSRGGRGYKVTPVTRAKLPQQPSDSHSQFISRPCLDPLDAPAPAALSDCSSGAYLISNQSSMASHALNLQSAPIRVVVIEKYILIETRYLKDATGLYSLEDPPFFCLTRCISSMQSPEGVIVQFVIIRPPAEQAGMPKG